VRCAPSAVVCIHRLHALYKPYIYIYIYIYVYYISFCLFYFICSKIELLIFFFRKTISRVPLCAAHRALSFAFIACMHFINHTFIYIYIFVYIIYIFLSLLFYIFKDRINDYVSGKRSREFRCALRTERCRLHTSLACTLNYAYINMYIYILYISFYLFYLIFKI